MKSRIDFTKGSIAKNLILFAVPIMAGEALQNLYHSVDSLVLGNFVGEAALAAVSICGTLTNLLVGFCNGMSVGSTVVVAKAFGSKNRKRLERTVLHSYTFSVLLGVVFSVIGVAFASFFVGICNVNPEIYNQALMYFMIFASGLVFTVVYNNSAGILRAMGDMRTPFVILMISSILNIFLDLLFSAVWSWGIKGVAIATVISQFVSVMISYYVIRFRLGFRCFDLISLIRNGQKEIKETVDVGFSSGMQSSLISFSNLFVWRYVNMFSTATVAGVGVAQRIDKFVSLPTNAFGNTATTFASQNIGAGDYDRTRKGIRICIYIAVGFSLTFSFIAYPIAPMLAKLYNRNPEVVKCASDMLALLIPFYFMNAIRQVIAGNLRARGRSKLSMLYSLAGMVVMRQIWLALSMHFNRTIYNVYLGYVIGWFFALQFVALYYIYCRKKLYERPAA